MSLKHIELTMFYRFHTRLGRCNYYWQRKWGLTPDQSHGREAGVETM